MSINDFINKIKAKFIYVDKITLMCSLVIIGVGISSFGLGRLSVRIVGDSTEETGSYEVKSSVIVNEKSREINIPSIKNREKLYVASKSGKMYYTIGCSGANRIQDKNKVYFASSLDAEKSGYQFSSSCK